MFAPSRLRRRAVLFLAPAAVLAAVFAPVRPTNFGGHDEWLVISLVTRGLIGFPYAARPLDLAVTLPGVALTPDDVLGYLIVHAAYLALAGSLTAWIAYRWLRLPLAVGVLAGVLTAVWAPRDDARLDAVLANRYSGTAVAALLATILFVAAWKRLRHSGSASGLVLAGCSLALAAAAVLHIEAALTLLAGAPLVAWAARPRALREPRLRRRFLWWSATWLTALALATAPLALAILRRGAGYQYQSAAGLDLAPLRLGSRVLRQYGAELAPLVAPSLPELSAPSVPLAVAALLAVLLLARGGRGGRGSRLRVRRRRLGRAAALGVALAGLAWLTLSLTPRVASPTRAQMLSAPGIGLLLASALGLAASWGRRTAPVLALGGGWLVALAAGRTATLQREWDERSLWPAQRGTLVQLTDRLPSLAPNTLVLLLDEAGAWQAGYGFRHALHYLYGASVVGHVWQRHEFLYALRLEADGIRSEPWPSIRRAWRTAPTLHRYDEVVVVRLRPDRRVRVLPVWPSRLPPLPPGARYAPRERVASAAPPASRRILRRER